MDTPQQPLPTTGRLRIRVAVLLGLYAVVFAAVFWFSFFIRWDFSVDRSWLSIYAANLLPLIAIKLAVFYAMGLCHISWRRIVFSELTSLIWASTLAMLIITTVEGLFLSVGFSGDLWKIPRLPRSVILLDWAATVMTIGGIRALWRSVQEELRPLLTSKPIRTALIVGADEHGELLARTLMSATDSQYFVQGFLDDDPRLRHTRLGRHEVLGSIDSIPDQVRRRRIDEVVVRSGSLAGRRFRELLDACTGAGIQLKVMPAVDELLSGDDHPVHVRPRPVEIKDLLRREPVQLDDAAVSGMIAGSVVLVTGAGGSIGAEVCRQVLRFHPLQLLLVERGENQLFLLEQELRRIEPSASFVCLIADITDEQRMEQILAEYRPQVIFHAAAHKHVPMMEMNAAEAVKNNVLGTRLLARLADRHGIREFVMISTDKAVNPTSVMGVTKLVAERVVQAIAAESRTKFVVVRFGNVLGSNGSVVPIFQEQIRRGGPVTITHPEIARYFMMIPEASQLVLQAAAMGKGGEVFVLDMGESVKIVDLARDLIGLSGLSEEDIEVVFTGLRPGEKLYEELYFADEERLPTSHPKVFSALHRPVSVAEVERLIDGLAAVCDAPPEAVRDRLRDLVPEYAQNVADVPVGRTPPGIADPAGEDSPYADSVALRKTHAK